VAVQSRVATSKSSTEADKATKNTAAAKHHFDSKGISVPADSKQIQHATAAAELKFASFFKANSAANAESLNSSLQDSTSTSASFPHTNVDAPRLSPRDSEDGAVPANFFVF
jgi:hypothetical protein